MLISGLDGAFVSAVASSGVLGCDTFPAGSVAFAVTSPAGSSFVGAVSYTHLTLPTTPYV